MQSSEIRAAGELVAGAFGGMGALPGELHEAIASRPFRVLGPMALPVRAIHDRVAGAAYRTVTRALGAVPRGGARALARAAPAQARPLASSLHGSIALGALNGAIGDALAREGSPLALPMTFRHRGQDLAPTREALAGAHPDATPALVVFVHGLCETDEAWRIGSGPGYGTRLNRELGYTPLHLRYNTGLHVSDNGRTLAGLLRDVVRAWPEPVEEIVLVGHSMGGLVGRSACHYGSAEWTSLTRHVFCLGSPHLGAPLEKAANVAGYALARLPETRPIAKLVNGRSVGIKDLRFGSCAEEDWCDCDPDEFLRDRCREIPFLDGAHYYFVGATVTPRPDHVAGSIVGDLLVRFPSASGRGRRRRIPFEIEHGHHVGGISHFHLLNHPKVYAQIHGWLARAHAPAAR